MFTWRFWRETLERGIKSAAQAPLLAWGVGDQVMNALAMDWSQVGGWALGGFILSVLTSVATIKLGAEDSPSAIP